MLTPPHLHCIKSRFILIWMKKRWLKFVIPVLSVLSVAGYLLLVNPLLVDSLNLREFDRTELNGKALEIASSLLGEEKQFRVKESITADMNLLKSLERSIGLKSEAEIVSTKLPVQIYTASFFPREGKDRLGLSNETPVLTVKIDSHGGVASLTFRDLDDKDNKPVSSSEAGGKIKRLASLLSLDPSTLTQVQPQDIDKEEWVNIGGKPPSQGEKESGESLARAEQEFMFNERIEGVPLASYTHNFSFTRNEVEYSRNLLFKKALFNEGSSGAIGFLAIVTWFAIGLLGLTIFGLKIRRDEIDWSHYFRFSCFVAVLTFLTVSFSEGAFTVLNFLGSLIVGFFIGFGLGLVFAVAESKTRENHSDTLAVSDALFGANFKIREFGGLLLSSFAYGGLFFMMPLAAYIFSSFHEKTRLVIWTANPIEISGVMPVTILLRSIVQPSLYAFLLSAPIFGILASLVCQRFPGKRGAIAVSAIFAVLCLYQLDTTPAVVWFILLFSASFLLCVLWKDEGFPGVLLSIFIALSLQRAFLLVLAKDSLFAFVGLVILVFWLFVFILAVYLLRKGKPVSKMAPYEPKYLKRMKEKERFERELEIAKHLQEKLLPKNTPDLEKFEIATLCEPANEVGGDYFDFLSLEGGKMLVFLGDVSGKGIRAAFYMTLAKGLLHGSFNLCKDHLELLTLLNKRFGGLSEEGVFLTLITLTLDTETGEVLLSSAGHNPPLLFKKDTVWSVPSRGLVIGPMPEEILVKSLKDFKFRMEEGDVLLLYTDGVTEAMDHHMEEYGTDRLKKVFHESVDKPAGEIVNSIRKSVLDHTKGFTQSDDLTILVLKAKKGAG